MELTLEQKHFFSENGYLVIPNLISDEALEELRSMVDRVLDGTLAPAEGGGVNGGGGGGAVRDFHLQLEPAIKDDPAIPRREKIRVVFHLCHTHPYFWGHATRPEILDAVRGLLGPRIKLYTDQMFVKPARHGSEVPFHQDHAYWTNIEPANMLTCWLALDDATIENGCVRVIPGTHKQRIPHIHLDNAVQTTGIPAESLDASLEVPVEIKAGGAMFHHSLVVHRSFPNDSDKGRRGLATIYMPSDFTFVDPNIPSVSGGWGFPYGFKDI